MADRCEFTRVMTRTTRKLSAPRVHELRAREESAGFTRLDRYHSFAEQVKETKRKLLEFLIQAKRAGKQIVGYGAPGKGNTLLNFCGIRTDFLDYTVDRSPHKQGKFLPGTHIPIYSPDRIRETRPDYVLILPWNLKDEIMKQNAYIREWGGQFVVPIPEGQALSVISNRSAAESRIPGTPPKEMVIMKVVLFCGGLGLRIRDAEDIPKPMVHIGYRPILWHVMKYYAHFGHKDFILCLGHRAEDVKNYFLNYNECASNDFVLSRGGKKLDLLQQRHPRLADHLRGYGDQFQYRPTTEGS